jgi:predicted component of type VI protein secretion system
MMADRPKNGASLTRHASRSRLASAIEADLAYFEARLALIGEQPASVYQQAQARTFELLSRQLQAVLERARQDGGKPKQS